MKEIALTNGGTALVDERDFARVSRFAWFRLVVRRNVYAARNANYGEGQQRVLLMHRFILGLWPGSDRRIDHRDNNGLNNQRSNLRQGHQRDAVRNQRIQTRPKSSRFKGVHWHCTKSRWAAGICVKGKTLHLGYFLAEVDAAAAYDKAAKQCFGEFAATNAELTATEDRR